MRIKAILTRLALGLVVASAIVGAILLVQRGATPRLAGKITNVRTLEMDASSSVAIVDFRFTNDSKHLFVVGATGMTVVDSVGNVREGQILAASNIKELFELFPALGEKTGDPLIIKTRIPAGASKAVMLAARFEISKSDLDARKKITVFVTDADGAVSEISK